MGILHLKKRVVFIEVLLHFCIPSAVLLYRVLLQLGFSHKVSTDVESKDNRSKASTLKMGLT